MTRIELGERSSDTVNVWPGGRRIGLTSGAGRVARILEPV
jgi:hypothetical protein